MGPGFGSPRGHNLKALTFHSVCAFLFSWELFFPLFFLISILHIIQPFYPSFSFFIIHSSFYLFILHYSLFILHSSLFWRAGFPLPCPPKAVGLRLQVRTRKPCVCMVVAVAPLSLCNSLHHNGLLICGLSRLRPHANHLFFVIFHLISKILTH